MGIDQQDGWRTPALLGGLIALVTATLLAGCAPSAGPGDPSDGSEKVQPSTSARPTPPFPVTLELPMRLGSRTVLKDRVLVLTASAAATELKRQVSNPSDAIANVYNGVSDADHAVVVSAAAGAVADPVAALDRLFTTLPRVTGIRQVDPGPLGGQARCGKGEYKGFKATVCAWADNISIGIVSFLSTGERNGDRSAEFVEVRGFLEHPVE